ncbi:hypothetical protein JRQ81_004872 [Phrynocephalus forsythii]|uniref:Uncharacterized protein n=1 Tax=Phrynocephalus forsythii TaxID=171643 RepID=A0A9Q0Y507_9SAUR|nr:hypothetical protein JRQ81_004872 [Phrynocephalus forsythii]
MPQPDSPHSLVFLASYDPSLPPPQNMPREGLATSFGYRSMKKKKKSEAGKTARGLHRFLKTTTTTQQLSPCYPNPLLYTLISRLSKQPEERNGGERTCGVHELICIRKVSPEAVGFLSAVGVFIFLLLILFLYINKKMCFENVGGFSDLNIRYSARKNSQDKLYNSYKNKDQHGSSSESEDEALGKYHEALSRTQRPPAGDNRQQKNYIWETRQKYSPLSAEYDGYSSEASIDEGKQKEDCLWLRLIHEGETPTHPRPIVAEKAGTTKQQKS